VSELKFLGGVGFCFDVDGCLLVLNLAGCNLKTYRFSPAPTHGRRRRLHLLHCGCTKSHLHRVMVGSGLTELHHLLSVSVADSNHIRGWTGCLPLWELICRWPANALRDPHKFSEFLETNLFRLPASDACECLEDVVLGNVRIDRTGSLLSSWSAVLLQPSVSPFKVDMTPAKWFDMFDNWPSVRAEYLGTVLQCW
jgi:hypothetical protein